MNERYVLDSSVATLAALQNPSVLTKMAQAQEIHVPEVVYGEMFFGAYRYARIHTSTKFLDLVEDFVRQARYKPLAGDLDTARIYGAIRAELDAKGQIIQPNDMWIAALTRQYGLILLARDGDFARVSGLSFEVV